MGREHSILISDLPLLGLLTISGSEPLKLPLIMLLVFGSAKLLAEIFETLSLPGIVGEIVAGVLLGPSVLNLLSLDPFLESLADLGVMFLLFRVGLEVKASELVGVGGTALLVATSGVVLPFFFGWAILRAWGAPFIDCVFVGAAMTATSVGITAQVLSAMGYLDHIASRIILAAAVIDDVLGLLVLAVVSSIARGHISILDLALTAVLASSFVVIVALWGTRAMKRIVPRAAKRLRASESEFALAICLLFALGLLATYAGVAAIVGAFLAGMALGESVNRRVHTLMHGATELLVPFFFVALGLRMDLGAFRSGSALLLAAAVILAAVISKLVGCGMMALRLGPVEALRIGIGMIPRGEVGMVVGQLGLTMAILRQDVYDVIVLMAIVTTLVAPPLIKSAFRPRFRSVPVPSELLR
jgi:Kef-type K+ transport system membrane component KefB